MTPLGEKLISLMKQDPFYTSKGVYIAPGIPAKKLNQLRSSTHCPDDEEVLCLVDTTLFGSAKNGFLYTDSGLYNTDFEPKYCTYQKLFEMFNEEHSEPDDLFGTICIGRLDSHGYEPFILHGAFWSEFFDLYAQYTGVASAKPATEGVKVCNYCGKKFDVSLDSCPGCGAPV